MSSQPRRIAFSGPVRSSPSPRWHECITIDLLIKVLQKSVFHPFIAWLLPLCLRAQATPYSHPAFIITTIYAACLTVWVILATFNKRIAYGPPRYVDFEDEVVVVAGGASGLGQAIAGTYGMRGISVAVIDVKNAADLPGDMRWDEFPNVEYYQCDMSNKEQVDQVAKVIEKELGAPTILINCIATAIHGRPLLSLSEQAIEKTLKNNLYSYFYALKAFLPRMLQSPTGGTIVTVSSVLSQLTSAGLSDYTASKAAVTAVHKTLNAEIQIQGASDNIKTILVETGQIATPLFDGLDTPNKFWAPILEPVQVAREIISMIDSGNGGVVRMPAYATFVSYYAILPVSIQRLARYLSGIDSAIGKSKFRKSGQGPDVM
ncbi:hypothetical protein FQN57_000006 [Myotisia sp. PD_48]|nr:hypothetical protein FQN57_000006 [Myotisia sp. PD_48]